MPYAAQVNMNDPNDPNKKPGGGVNISGQSGDVATNVPGQEPAGSGAPAGEKQKSSGQYTNIQTYLDANKQQGDDMGSKIAGDVGAKAEDASSKIQSYESKAPTVAAYDPNEAIANSNSLTDDQKASYKAQKATGGYTGPANVSGVEGYDDVQKAGTEATGLVKNIGNEQGQREVLKQTYARPSYSSGENNLDQALLQGSGGSRSKLENLSTKYSGLGDALNTANTKVGTAINSANSQALANKQAFTPAEEAARKALLDPIQARAAQASLDNGFYGDRIANDVTDNVLSDETLALLGLNEGTEIYNTDLSQYLKRDQTQAGIDNVATADERSKYASLAGLFDDQSMNQITAEGKGITPVSFNKDQFDKDLAGRNTEYNKAYTQTKGLIALPPQAGMYFNGNEPQNFTPEQLETTWLPQWKAEIKKAQDENNSMGMNVGGNNGIIQGFTSVVNQVEAQLAGMKNKYGVGRKIQKG